MAQVPYEHIEAPTVLNVDGVRAFNPGDPVPVETARTMGLLDGDDAPPVLPPYGDVPVGFVDGVITVAPADDAAAHPSVVDAPPATTTTAAPEAPTPPASGSATTTATPPQAPAKPPKQGA